MAEGGGDAFITSVPLTHSSTLKNKNKKRGGSNDILDHVRRDHSRIMHVVKEFGGKISTMYVCPHNI